MRRNFISAFVAGMAVAFALGGCQHKMTAVPTSFDSVVVDKNERLVPGDTLSPACTLHVNLKYATPEDSVTRLINESIVRMALDKEGTDDYAMLEPQVAVDSFVTSYIRDYRTDLTPYYKEELQKGNVGSWYNYQYELNTSTVPSKDGVWGYQLELITYEGGAHGSHTITYMNFDKTTGRQLTLDDVFAPGYVEPLTQVLLVALQDKLQMKSLDELHDNGFLTWTDMYPTPNFLLGPDGVRFYYNAYEIAPYACGPTELVVSYEALKDLLKQEANQ